MSAAWIISLGLTALIVFLLIVVPALSNAKARRTARRRRAQAVPSQGQDHAPSA